jgi:RNA polymerase sigma-70 factor (ECF subfamily)
MRPVDASRTTAAVQRYLDDLADVSRSSEAEPVIRELLARAVNRLHLLCANLLHRSYPRLTRGPFNVSADEILGAVVERMLKAMRQIRPASVRQFFALASQHMRWELNDLARRLDKREIAIELRESWVTGPPEKGADTGPPAPSPTLSRILSAIDELPEDEREAFNLVRLQAMGVSEAARVVGVSSKTIQRRLKRSLVLLTDRVGDLGSNQYPQPP